MNYRPILVITKTILILLCINNVQAQSEDKSNYIFLQGGYFNTNASGVSGFGTVNFGYLSKVKDNIVEGMEINIKSISNKEIIRSVQTFLDTTQSMRLVGGNVDYIEIGINYTRAKEYIQSDKIGFGLMSGLGSRYKRKETNPRVDGGMAIDINYDIHIYTGPYLTVDIADKLSLLLDWNMFELSVGMSTTDLVDDNGELFEQGPFLDLELNGLFNHLHIGVMYAL